MKHPIAHLQRRLTPLLFMLALHAVALGITSPCVLAQEEPGPARSIPPASGSTVSGEELEALRDEVASLRREMVVMREDIKGMNARLAVILKHLEDGEDARVSVSADTPEGAFEVALAAFERGEFDRAYDRALSFLRDYPESEKCLNMLRMARAALLRHRLDEYSATRQWRLDNDDRLHALFRERVLGGHSSEQEIAFVLRSTNIHGVREIIGTREVEGRVAFGPYRMNLSFDNARIDEMSFEPREEKGAGKSDPLQGAAPGEAGGESDAAAESGE